MIYGLWADCWHGVRELGLPGIFGSPHMHYSIDLCISTGKLGVQKCQTRVHDPPASLDSIFR